MAQQVVIAGALFNDVPSISVPDSNSVYHPFVDPSVTTAAASDVAQGKQFIAADGTLTQGTASGGGGSSIVWGPIRGDAELVKSWTYDKKIHADEGVTIPSYSTTITTLKAAASLSPTISCDFSSYSYITLIRGIATPEYSISTTGNGKFCYSVFSYVQYCSGTIASAYSYNGLTPTTNSNSAQFNNVYGNELRKFIHYSSGSSIRLINGGYGLYFNTSTQPSYSVGSSPYTTATLTVSSPALMIRGNSSYLSSTYYNALTDARFQYIIEVYRVPTNSTVKGWEQESQLYHVIDCMNNGGTLT